MPEYIERGKIFSVWRSMPAPASVESLSAAIHQTPVADVAPVVRCKDCKHFGGHGICFYHAADVDGTPIFVREDDFCSYGERKDNE